MLRFFRWLFEVYNEPSESENIDAYLIRVSRGERIGVYYPDVDYTRPLNGIPL